MDNGSIDLILCSFNFFFNNCNLYDIFNDTNNWNFFSWTKSYKIR